MISLWHVMPFADVIVIEFRIHGVTAVVNLNDTGVRHATAQTLDHLVVQLQPVWHRTLAVAVTAPTNQPVLEGEHEDDRCAGVPTARVEVVHLVLLHQRGLVHLPQCVGTPAAQVGRVGPGRARGFHTCMVIAH